MHLSSSLLVLTSPPASGKTYWIKSFVSQYDENKVLIISPLRALADECREKWGAYPLVMTPEEWTLKKVSAEVVIFDEFHLHFYWGDTFRPLMWEVFYELSTEAKLIVLLTATLPLWMKEEIETYGTQFNQLMWVDQGNQQLKTPPVKYIKAPGKRWLTEYICGNFENGVRLIFCQYREEVFWWKRHLQEQGFVVWSCVGGEAQEMKSKMASGERPHFIVATTVLSHGVNLPEISCVYLLYPLKNQDFWIQMVARGGRKGGDYRVFALENPYGIKWNPIANFLAIIHLSLKMKKVSLLRQLQSCFLKE